MTGMRKRHSGEVKLKVVIEALAGSKSIAHIASDHGVHPTQIKEWKAQALEDALLHGTPAIFNSDQGSQFTSQSFTNVLIASALAEAEQGIAAYIRFYNERRPHQALAYQTPEQVHFADKGNKSVTIMC